MQVDLSPILDSPQYNKDKVTLYITGKQRARTIYLIVACIFLPFLWPILIAYAAWYFSKTRLDRIERIRLINEFVAKNNFRFQNNATRFISTIESTQTVDLPYGKTQLIKSYDIQGSINGHNFSYSLASLLFKDEGRNSSGYAYIIFTIELPVELPRMFINSKFNNLPGMEARVINFVDEEDHELEGDFSKYYDVRIEKNEQIDMLTILTPEVMQVLKDNNLYDIWLDGRQLTLITFADQTRYFASIPAIFTNCSTLLNEIDRIARALR